MSEAGEYKKAYSTSMLLNGSWFSVSVVRNNRYSAKLSYLSYVSLVAQTVKNLPARQETPGFDSWVGKIPWRRE